MLGSQTLILTLAGYRLTNEAAIRTVKDWKRVDSGGVVTVIDAFTSRAFGDSSLIFVTNYHPLAKTMSEVHFTGPGNQGHRFNSRASASVSEQIIWSYVVQISSALKAIHTSNLAARCIDASKILVTDKNRVRLNACAILDVIKFENFQDVRALQQEDFLLLGNLILALVTNNMSSHQPMKNSMDHLQRQYSPELHSVVLWLLEVKSTPKTVNELLAIIAPHMAISYDHSLHANDTMYTELSREIENGRIARLLMKLGTINERPEFDNDRSWAENGERYMLKLFRDYVFHQVDAEGRPVLDLGHILTCLNKLDAGSNERITLISRDEQSQFIVKYQEVKKQIESAFNELQKGGRGPGNRVGGY